MAESTMNKYKNISLMNIKSKYVLQLIFDNLKRNKYLRIINYNKKIQNRLDKDINYYKNEFYYKIIIELTLIEPTISEIVGVHKKYEPYFHIYLNDSNEEIQIKKINNLKDIIKIKFIMDKEIKIPNEFFKNQTNLKKINFIKFNCEDFIDMSYMFSGCSSLEEIEISNFNTPVTNMSNMFNECSLLKKIVFSNFNTNNVTNMSGMFFGCSSLEELNLSSFNTKNVTNMGYMFYKCTSLKKINLSNFDTNNVINMNMMFYDCSSLKELNLSCFNTNNVICMNYMFNGCSSLKVLDITHFNTDKITLIRGIFDKCPSLIKLKCLNAFIWKLFKDKNFYELPDLILY